MPLCCKDQLLTRHLLAPFPRYALTDLRRQGVSVHPEAVRWCVTLPAMWTEADKRRVRDAAERTGGAGIMAFRNVCTAQQGGEVRGQAGRASPGV